mmetsp:Transcript_838/g.1884  ORF Transcript_838/g.1884 Transcript_838/m.1884 type:complete len:257 (+) Transcript_838:431-1201(+)
MLRSMTSREVRALSESGKDTRLFLVTSSFLRRVILGTSVGILSVLLLVRSSRRTGARSSSSSARSEPRPISPKFMVPVSLAARICARYSTQSSVPAWTRLGGGIRIGLLRRSSSCKFRNNPISGGSRSNRLSANERRLRRVRCPSLGPIVLIRLLFATSVSRPMSLEISSGRWQRALPLRKMLVRPNTARACEGNAKRPSSLMSREWFRELRWTERRYCSIGPSPLCATSSGTCHLPPNAPELISTQISLSTARCS